MCYSVMSLYFLFFFLLLCCLFFFVFFFKQKTAYEIYQCDWSSDVCSSDLYVTNNEIGKRLHLVIETEGRAVCRESNKIF